MADQTPINQLPNMGQPLGAPAGAPAVQQFADPISHSATNEELIEAIIDEKWNELVKDVNKILEWKNQTESRINRIEQSMIDLKDEFTKLHQGILGKIGEYDKHIMDVGSEIKAMEKVFAKVLPVFTQNVSELTRITDDLKRTK